LGIDRVSTSGMDNFPDFGMDVPEASSKDTTAMRIEVNFILSIYFVGMRRFTESNRLTMQRRIV
jgi:hypothetical protein